MCYVESNGVAVAWGDPLCAPADQDALLREFLAAMRSRGVRTSLLVLQVEEEVAALALAIGCSVLRSARSRPSTSTRGTRRGATPARTFGGA